MNGKVEIQNYINEYINNIKQCQDIDTYRTFRKSIKCNLFIGILIWILGTTVIGIPIVYGIIGYKGFCFGYAVSSIIATIGAKQGVLISIISICIQNIIFIPSIILISTSGVKLYKNIIKDKKRKDFKIEIYKHFIVSMIGFLGIILSSIIESFIATKLMIFFAKYI